MQNQKNNFWAFSGWAAAILFGSILVYTNFLNKKSTTIVTGEKQQLEEQVERVKSKLAKTEKLLEVFRDRNIISVPLAGQNASPTSYAKVYWDKKTNTIYLDAKGLPTPPKGKVYQVWSLKITPLTPTSIGTLDTFTTDADKIFTIENPNISEAFGITLEPIGGSETPNLEKLYALGAVKF